MKIIYACFYLAFFCIALNVCQDGGAVYKTVNGKEMVYSGTLLDDFQCIEVNVVNNRVYSYWTTEQINPKYFKAIDKSSIRLFLNKLTEEAEKIEDIKEAEKYIQKHLVNKKITVNITIKK